MGAVLRIQSSHTSWATACASPPVKRALLLLGIPKLDTVPSGCATTPAWRDWPPPDVLPARNPRWPFLTSNDIIALHCKQRATPGAAQHPDSTQGPAGRSCSSCSTLCSSRQPLCVAAHRSWLSSQTKEGPRHAAWLSDEAALLLPPSVRAAALIFPLVCLKVSNQRATRAGRRLASLHLLRQVQQPNDIVIPGQRNTLRDNPSSTQPADNHISSRLSIRGDPSGRRPFNKTGAPKQPAQQAAQGTHP